MHNDKAREFLGKYEGYHIFLFPPPKRQTLCSQTCASCFFIPLGFIIFHMQFHFHTLEHLAQWLNQEYRGWAVEKVFSQNRNELIVVFDEEKILRIGCHTPLTYLVPVSVFSRARKNVVDLFPEIIGLTLGEAMALPYDRVLTLRFSEGWELVIKMHSISSNVLLRRDGEIRSLFNHQLENDWEYVDAPGSPSLEASLREDIPAEAKAVKEALRHVSVVYDKGYVQRCLALMEEGQHFAAAFAQLQRETQANDSYLYREDHRVRYSLIPVEPEKKALRIDGVVAGLQMFLRTHFQLESYLSQYKTLDQAIKKPLLKKQGLLNSYLESLAQMEALRNPEELGHLLMAYLHEVIPGTEQVILPDLYLGGEVEISIDPKLSPQENATRYYHKSKNRKHKVAHLRQQVEELEEAILAGMADLEAFDALPTPASLQLAPTGWQGDAFQDIKPLMKQHRQEEQESVGRQLPFRVFQREGYDILVGKNARNNDELSFHFAAKNDLWLHAKDVTGSHVVIRLKAGKDLPPGVLEYAAQLAAFYSKRKSDTLVPVIYTPRKYIRKRKGDPPGLVAVDRMKVIMVEPIRV